MRSADNTAGQKGRWLRHGATVSTTFFLLDLQVHVTVHRPVPTKPGFLAASAKVSRMGAPTPLPERGCRELRAPTPSATREAVTESAKPLFCLNLSFRTYYAGYMPCWMSSIICLHNSPRSSYRRPQRLQA